MARTTHCLLVYPRFTLRSFWNFRATCELRGARYPTTPLGLITVAALLPNDWELRLVDCNVEELTDADLDWADLVLTGGMLPQQAATLQIIRRVQSRGKTVIVGGPDVTSSPHVYDHADIIITGEAELTVPQWLADLYAGRVQRRYDAGEKRADVSASPLPRFDLLKLDRYLYCGIQFARGCPFLCEFCDIIELFGRVPRLKTTDQMLGELDRLYELGHRGHVDFVDDNFIGNKRDVKKFLEQLIVWQQEHHWPFEFSTEASINLADDDALLSLMQQAGFSVVFVGIESPDEDTLRQIRKSQNTKRQLAASLHKIYSYGMYVTTGYIVGFDSEQGNVADGVLELIEAGATPINMVGLLFALPGTQLTRRLQQEGRLHQGFDRVDETYDFGDQCTAGLNFETKRPRAEIMRDFHRIVAESYAPGAFFARVRRVCLALNCSQKKHRLPWPRVLRDLMRSPRLIWRAGIRPQHRLEFWRTLATVLRRNPGAFWYAVTFCAMFLHFDEFRDYLLLRIQQRIDFEESAPPPVPVVLIS